MDGVRIVEEEVREVIRMRGLDPARESNEVRRIVYDAVRDYDERSMRGTLPRLGALDEVNREVFDAVAGFGPLQPLLDDPTIEEIWINSPTQVFCARGGTSELTSIRLSDEQVETLVERMLKPSGRRLDLSSPFVDAALPDGSRLHVVIPDITRRHWSVNIRKFVARAQRIDQLVELGSLSPAAARYLQAAISSGMNVLVSGATQAGKTTMLNCLTSAIGVRERVVTIEEIFELQVNRRDVVSMQCRQANLEGGGEITMRRLVKEALRMRPDRVIIGEVREAESLDMLIAMNAGLPAMASIHANSARDAITKICTLPLLAGENITPHFVVPTVATSIDLVVHCERMPGGHRQVSEIVKLGQRVENGVIESSQLFTRIGGELVVNNNAELVHDKLERAGVDLAELAEVVA
ncbi:CpaF family protein [Zhihengliuella salsuginis]|uniref:Pilus assembly protein CpaF n=1 Tax=Zhihengliuella salsuginis TaxID=578222 RepID=A0ABQ3GKK8_9MICC|nr:ATPase, T2SS/T4P/T4SS family [Zhihengliuella salsuginis]GHD08822.1 pilus assembly protein CpaF [Zhihengliuella salsuginis]